MKIHTKLLMGAAAAALLATGPTAVFAQRDKTAMPSNSNNLTFDTTPEDHARIREIFGNERDAQNVHHVRFRLAPGSVVPGSIHLVPLPQTIINIEPTWQGNDYFRVGQKVVIVDPQSKKIEGVIAL